MTTPAEPPDAYPLARLPTGYPRSQLVDHADDLMAGHPGKCEAWYPSFLRKRITMADAARFDHDPHPPEVRFRRLALDQLELGSRSA
jgi:hypothetical protein